MRNTKALDRMIGPDGFACCGRLPLADCILAPAFFLMDYPLPTMDVETPTRWNPNIAADWAAIRNNEHAAKVLGQLQRGLEERLEAMRNGSFQARMAAAAGLVAEDAAYKIRAAQPA